MLAPPRPAAEAAAAGAAAGAAEPQVEVAAVAAPGPAAGGGTFLPHAAAVTMIPLRADRITTSQTNRRARVMF